MEFHFFWRASQRHCADCFPFFFVVCCSFWFSTVVHHLPDWDLLYLTKKLPEQNQVPMTWARWFEMETNRVVGAKASKWSIRYCFALMACMISIACDGLVPENRQKGQKIESSQKAWHWNAIGQHKMSNTISFFCTCLVPFCLHQCLSEFILFDERNGQVAIESTNQHLTIWTSSGLSELSKCD